MNDYWNPPIKIIEKILRLTSSTMEDNQIFNIYSMFNCVQRTLKYFAQHRQILDWNNK